VEGGIRVERSRAGSLDGVEEITGGKEEGYHSFLNSGILP
jgi:hypothetical protein